MVSLQIERFAKIQKCRQYYLFNRWIIVTISGQQEEEEEDDESPEQIPLMQQRPIFDSPSQHPYLRRSGIKYHVVRLNLSIKRSHLINDSTHQDDDDVVKAFAAAAAAALSSSKW